MLGRQHLSHGPARLPPGWHPAAPGAHRPEQEEEMLNRRGLLGGALAVLTGTVSLSTIAEAQPYGPPPGPPGRGGPGRPPPPPPPRREGPHGRAPSRAAVWQPGHWSWRGGNYVWVSGRWIERRRRGNWHDGRWVERRGRWVWVEPGWN
jgi:hypothetical protein